PRPVERLSVSRSVPPPADTHTNPPAVSASPSLRLVTSAPPKAPGASADPKQAASQVLEDYFDQLDAAVAARAAGLDVPPPTRASGGEEIQEDLPPAPPPTAHMPAPVQIAPEMPAEPPAPEPAPVPEEPSRWSGPERRRPVAVPRPVEMPERRQAFEIPPVETARDAAPAADVPQGPAGAPSPPPEPPKVAAMPNVAVEEKPAGETASI